MRTSQCGVCLRYRGSLDCDAYPQGIPESILTGVADHTRGQRGDGGKLFKPFPGALIKAEDHPGVEAVVDNVNDIYNQDNLAYTRIKSVLKRRGYVDADFETGGPLYGWSVNELITLVRGSDND